jgi:hypothetical protein
MQSKIAIANMAGVNIKSFFIVFSPNQADIMNLFFYANEKVISDNAK